MKKVLSTLMCAIFAVSASICSAGAYTYYPYYSYIVTPSYASVYNHTDTSLEICWGSSSNAQGYILYCKKPGQKFKRIKTIKSKYTTSYIHKKLKTGKKYSYKVKAYGKINGKRKYSSYTSTASKKVIEPLTMSKPSIYTVTQLDTDTFKISWGKLSRASGYTLYYSTNGKTFKTLKSFGKSKSSYTHTGLNADTKYFYKIRAYRNTASGTKYSKYSSQLGKTCSNYLVDLYEPYNKSNYISILKGADTVNMGGEAYGNGIEKQGHYEVTATYNLKGKYKTITLTAGAIDGSTRDTTISIYSDDTCVASFDVESNALPKSYTVDIKNANKLEFEMTSERYSYVAITNIKLFK